MYGTKRGGAINYWTWRRKIKIINAPESLDPMGHDDFCLAHQLGRITVDMLSHDRIRRDGTRICVHIIIFYSESYFLRLVQPVRIFFFLPGIIFMIVFIINAFYLRKSKAPCNTRRLTYVKEQCRAAVRECKEKW